MSKLFARRFLERTMLVAHNGNTSTGERGRQDAAVVSQTSRRVPPAPRSIPKWIGAFVVSWNRTSIFSARGLSYQRIRSLLALSPRSKPIVNKRMWHRRVVRPVCPQMPVHLPVLVFLTHSAVRCPFVRRIDMHNAVLEGFISQKFVNVPMIS
ncbi:unnamed protein product [Euphydryas editha]|uniref:Uncharacterized protein n=1 Tax=Euphydryas editha TaxID=104508 RepID=A0AAU9V8G3_EUPED|nr:unnamed protein product [Euphydryas editha]